MNQNLARTNNGQNSQGGESNREEKDLSTEEIQRYETLKSRLQEGEKEQAKLLYRLKENELFRVEYDTFADFCKSEVGYSRRQADRYANWGRVMSIVGPNGPTCEAHARPLSSIQDPDDVREIWETARERSQEENMTAELVREVRSRFLGPQANGPEGKTASNPNSGEESSTTGASSVDSSADELRPSRSPSSTEDVSPTSQDATSTTGSPSSNSDFSNSRSTPPDRSTSTPISIAVPPDIAAKHGIERLAVYQDERKDLHLPHSELTLDQLHALTDDLSADSAPPLISRPPFVDGVFFPLESENSESGLPLASKSLSPPKVLRLRTLVQIQRKVGRDRSSRILLSPGTDPFHPTVPSLLTDLVLTVCQDAECTTLLYTDHLLEVPGEQVPDSVWIGSPSTPSTIEETEAELDASGLASGWVRLDLQPDDLRDEIPLSSGSPVDWIVCDSPNGSISEEDYGRLTRSVRRADAKLFLIDPLQVLHRTLPGLEGNSATDA